ncbi:MAG: hypothetical protein GYA24_06210 [Candidatus Lokiarchaeota archaeon]|nr:hypothetical protein [Candidatus Lokiarchaeota archaeon]
MPQRTCPVCEKRPRTGRSRVELQWYTCQACDHVYCITCGPPGICNKCLDQLDPASRRQLRVKTTHAFALSKAGTMKAPGLICLIPSGILSAMGWIARLPAYYPAARRSCS